MAARAETAPRRMPTLSACLVRLDPPNLDRHRRNLEQARGMSFRRWLDEPTTRGADILRFLRQGLSDAELFQLRTISFTADAGSYPYRRRTIFTDRGGQLVLEQLPFQALAWLVAQPVAPAGGIR